MDAAESLCPHVMKRSNLRTELIKASSSKMVVPKSFVTKTLLEQSGVDIINKIRQVCECPHACVCVFLLLWLTSFSMSQRGEAESGVFSLGSDSR